MKNVSALSTKSFCVFVDRFEKEPFQQNGFKKVTAFLEKILFWSFDENVLYSGLGWHLYPSTEMHKHG